MPAQLAVPGKYFQCSRHPETVAGRGKDVHRRRQVLQGHNAQGQQSTAGDTRRHTAR